MTAFSFTEVLSSAVRIDQAKFTGIPCIQLLALKDCLGMYKIPIGDTVLCNDGEQDTGKIYFIKKIELES